MIADYQDEIYKIKETLIPFKGYVKRPASGRLPYDYLIPAGPYQAQYDWDSFFIGVTLATDISSEAIYLKNWVANQVINAKTNGKVTGCLTPKGYDERFNHMKPFLAQGAYLAGKFLKDYFWLKKMWAKIKKVVLYREKHQWNKKYDLGVWHDGMESGMDNNVAVLDYPKNTVVGVDLNAYIFQEYKAMAIMAKMIGRKKDEKYFSRRAEQIKNNINKYLYNDQDKIYYNLDSKSGEHIKRVSASCFSPLFADIASSDQAKLIITKYLLSPSFMWSRFGVRTLAANDSEYNNKNIVKPFSNWQGPIWLVFNYICMQGLLRYGFQKEAIELAQKTIKLILDDISATGGMHENYHADTGQPLAAQNKVSWNLLTGNMLSEALENKNPFEIS